MNHSEINCTAVISFMIVTILCICLVGFAGLVIPSDCRAASESAALPEINAFKVSPSSISPGSSALLVWDVKNASIVNIDHGVGDVSAVGQVNVSPAYSTTYKITVSNSTGIRTRFITLYVTTTQIRTSDTVNSDPVTGRNASVDLNWEDYCYSSEYQVQIARDSVFTLKVYDSGILQPADTSSPAFWYPPGRLEAGHTYYWRVRTTRAVTGQWAISPWSEARPITVKPGYAVRANYDGIQALSPVNSGAGCPVGPISFSWSGYPDTTKYRFILARDAQLQNIVVEDFTANTAYAYNGALEYDASYFWQVMAVEPVPSDPSSLFTFYTLPAPRAVSGQSTAASVEAPLWAIVVIIAGVLLIGIVTLFAVKARERI